MKKSDDFIPHSRPTIGQADIDAVSQVLASGQIAQGPAVEQFEREFAACFGFSNAVATSSGTAALHLALIGLNVGCGDEVILPAYVCTALLNAVEYVRATPVLADVDPRTGNIDAASVKGLVTEATRAIIVAHMFGLPVDMEPLCGFGIPIIEDCAQSVGAQKNQRPVGSFGEIAVFSFYATKMLATGEGGMVVCRSAAIADRLRDLRSYDECSDYKTRYNYKLTDIQAALGRSQLGRLESMLSRRRAIACFYRDALQECGPELPPEIEGRTYFRYAIGIESNPGDWLKELNGRRIGCARPVYRPLNHYIGPHSARLPGTEYAYRHFLSIPIYPSLSDADIERVVLAVKQTQASFRRSGSLSPA